MQYNCPTSGANHAKRVSLAVKRDVLQKMNKSPFLTPGNEECPTRSANNIVGESYWDEVNEWPEDDD